jgi:hypothetical protein
LRRRIFLVLKFALNIRKMVRVPEAESSCAPSTVTERCQEAIVWVREVDRQRLLEKMRRESLLRK